MTNIFLGKTYEILEKIDSGGMADIYRAVCKKTNKIVALKVLKDKFSGNPEYIHRFKREAETVFALEHENIVSITDVGFDGGVYYIIMEYIGGSTLKALIEKNGRIDETTAVRYAMQVCSALSAAHKKGIIHRDIKPHNILIDKEDNVKLTDFGIAKSLSSAEEQENKIIGSVHYISPEQAKGERVDSRSDIYSLGIVLYEMVTGVLPHTGGKTVSVALKHINEQITPPAEINGDVSKALNHIILKATSKNKKDRYQSVNQLKADLIRSVKDPDGMFLDILETNNKPSVDPIMLKKKNLFWKTGMLALLIAVSSAAVILIITLFNPSDTSIIVPDLVGTDIDLAERKLLQLTVNTFYEPNESAEEGTIISQSPDAGSMAASGEVINLTISSGPAGLVMPDLAGKTLAEAKAQIEAMGLTLKKNDIIYEYQPDMPPGLVISQIPEAGEALNETGALSLTVSGENAQDKILMPDLSGLPLEQALGLLNDAGFTHYFVYEENSDSGEGTVLSQSPEDGVHSSYTDDIFLHISKYRNKGYNARFAEKIDITEKESKVWVVLEYAISGKTVSFIVDEKSMDPGWQPINLELNSFQSGRLKVVIYVNNKPVNSKEVNFR